VEPSFLSPFVRDQDGFVEAGCVQGAGQGTDPRKGVCTGAVGGAGHYAPRRWLTGDLFLHSPRGQATIGVVRPEEESVFLPFVRGGRGSVHVYPTAGWGELWGGGRSSPQALLTLLRDGYKMDPRQFIPCADSPELGLGTTHKEVLKTSEGLSVIQLCARD